MENVNIAVNIIHNSSVIDGILSFADKNNIAFGEVLEFIYKLNKAGLVNLKN